MNYWSKERKLPFIEFNGVQYHDSDFAMHMLADYFKLDYPEADLTDEQKGMTRAMFKLAEQSLCEYASNLTDFSQSFLTIQVHDIQQIYGKHGWIL